jgi:VWFA-related protein
MGATGRVPAGLALAALTWGASASAQAPAAKPQPLVVRIGVDIVQIDAVVTDKKGRHVTDLKPEDFEILQDKKPRAVSYAQYVVADTAPAAPRRVMAAADVPPPTTPALRPEDVRRSMAFVVDNLSPTGVHATREALQKLVNEDLRVGDLVAIVRTRGGLGILPQFTSDRRVLDAAIADLRYRPGDTLGHYDSATSCGLFTGAYSDFVASDYWSRRQEAGALTAINFVLENLRELPGRKSVVVFSEGLSLFGHSDWLGRPATGDPEIIDAVRRVTDLANRSSVVLYAVDPGGLRTRGITAAHASPFSASNLRSSSRFGYSPALEGASNVPFWQSAGRSYGDTLQCQAMAELDAHSGLETLARQTGGLFFPNENRPGKAVAEVFEDQKGYYVLGYAPDDRTFEKSRHGGPLFHNLKVRVKREGLRVRSRAGFIGVTDAEDVRPAPKKTQDRLLRVMASPFTASEIPVRLTAVFGHDPRHGYVVRSLVHIDGSHVTLAPRPGGDGHDVKLELGAAVFGANGVLAQGASHDVSFHVKPEGLEHVRRAGLVVELNVPVAKPGTYQFRVGLRDAAAAATGTARQLVHVPDLSKRRLALSGVVVGTAPGLSAAETAADVRVAFDEARLSPAVRRFQAGSELQYALAVYHPETDRRSGQPQLSTTLRLVRDGQEVLTTDVVDISTTAVLAAPSGNTKVKKVPSYVMEGTLRLPASLAPGEYALQVVVTDELTKSQARRTGQWTAFEIVGDTSRVAAGR